MTFDVGNAASLKQLEQPAHHCGLADPAAADYGHHPDPRIGHIAGQHARFNLPVLKPGRCDRRRRVNEPRRPHRLLLCGYLLSLQPARHPPPGIGQLPQRPLHQLPQLGGAVERLNRQPAVLYPITERVLPVPKLSIDQLRRRNANIARVGVQHEDQPILGRLGGGVELQLGVGNLRHIPHRRAIPGAQQPHIHLATAHPLRTQLCRYLIRGRKIPHIHNHMPGSRYRPVHLRHIRHPRRVVPQVPSMRNKNPPSVIAQAHCHIQPGLGPSRRPSSRRMRRSSLRLSL